MRIGVMCSGEGTNFENIVHSCPDHDIVLMVYNKKKCGAKKRADRLGINSIRIASKDEDDIITIFNAYEVDLIVMAGWMRIVTKKFCNAFAGKVINLHPSLLPKYKGLHAVEQALQSGDDETGCTVHFVTEELDSGGIIKQQTVPILPGDTVESLQRAIQQAEHYLLPLVINAF
jgi:formyltetrahydrofolate-dependent phosphoribosylglycinamide formyltransferase|tara:strand:- start:310 stop:831 length:522 start_codon:yes stop_codon:yes gene_type:complete